ncbi:MAG TPA: YeeE/YedE thiosulfate transporter family protein [Thermoanaerobaculia bacterium]|nr:YeeE/YedE thiosulfate transporter family protein [Thermoanaerobaculia bacterium]
MSASPKLCNVESLLPRAFSPRPYADPYVAGVGLGLVLLAAYVVVGRGLGASGAFASGAAGVVAAVSPARAAGSPYFARYLAGDGPWREWLLFEIAGVVIGGFLSALAAGRLRATIERGPRIGRGGRLACAFAGGSAMGAGAVLARGCTSGLALTGGALLSAGSWLFMMAAFAGAYLFAPIVKRAWR